MPTQKKIEIVKKLTDKIAQAKSMFLVDYRGLKHKQMEELRKILWKINAEFVVTKNRLLRRALADQPASFKDALQDTTAVLFAYADEIIPLKELLRFVKTAGIGKTKSGLLGSQFLDSDQVVRLAQLPPRQMLLGQLVGQLNAPIQGLHYALSWNTNKLVWALNQIQSLKSK